jgi:hypothetical protein
MVNRISSASLAGESVNIDTIMSVYLYGTLAPPQALYERIKPEDYVISLDDNAVEFILDANYYMVSGAGRFARAAEAEIVGVFLDPTGPFEGLPAGVYTFSDLELLGAYNRGYAPGVEGLDEAGQVGPFRIVNPLSIGRTATTYAEWQAASFYAVAYTHKEALGRSA